MAKYKTFPIFQVSTDNTLTPVTNPTAVELWTTGAGAAKIKSIADGTILNNYDGTYQMDIEGLTTGVYDIKVNFGAGLTTPDEFHNIYVAGDDALLESYVDDDTLEFTSGSLRVKDDGIDKTKIASDVAGDGLKQNAGGDLSPDVDGTTIEVGAVTKKLNVKAGVFGSQADLDTAEAAIDALEASVGTLGWVGTMLEVLNPSNLVDAIKSVASMVKSLYDAFLAGAAIYNRRVIFSANTFAAAADGSVAAAMTEWLEDSNLANRKVKIRGSFKKLAGDKYIVFNCQGKIAAITDGLTIYLNILGTSLIGTADIWTTTYSTMIITHDISTLIDNQIYEFTVEQFTDQGTEIGTMKDVEILITGA